MAKMILTNGCYAAEKGSWNWLTNGYGKFSGNKNITFWFADLPNLTNGYSILQDCSNLTSFSGDLSNMTDGQQMFYQSTKLTSFRGDLSSLSYGNAMFGSSTYDCTKLDLASVQNIADTINDLTAAGTTDTIGIGMQKSLQSDDETAPINVALAAIRAKGWTVNEIYSDN